MKSMALDALNTKSTIFQISTPAIQYEYTFFILVLNTVKNYCCFMNGSAPNVLNLQAIKNANIMRENSSQILIDYTGYAFLVVSHLCT